MLLIRPIEVVQMARRSKIPQGVFPASIHNLTHEGRGIADIEGKKVFIAGALPGEDVTFEYRFVKRRLAQGQALEVLKASPNRSEPLCKHFDVCGGCAIQHLNPEAAFEFKKNVVLEQFEHFAKLKPELMLEPFLSPLWGYRKKARLGVRYVPKKGGMMVGFREKFSNRLAVMNSCEVLDPSVGQLIDPLKTLLNQVSIKEQIPQIEIAVGDTCTALVIRHLVPLEDKDSEVISAFCKEFGLSFYSQSKGVDSVIKIYPPDQNELLRYRLQDQEIDIDFHPLDFTQVNTHINEKMVAAAIQELDIQPNDKVLDLFCGIGNFTLPLAKKSKFVVGVEGSVTAIDRANHNKVLNQLDHTQFYVNDLFKDDIDAPWINEHFDKILLDPPRSGALAMLPWLAKQKAKKIMYISCNPATLARDAGILVHEYGFTLKTLRVMDMFPHTSHVETMAVFERG